MRSLLVLLLSFAIVMGAHPCVAQGEFGGQPAGTREVTGAVGDAAAAQAAASSVDLAQWRERVREFKRLWSPGHPEQAVKALLAEGRERTQSALLEVLRNAPSSDPIRVDAALAMALTDLDYPLARSVLLEYFPWGNRLAIDEDALSLYAQVYERRKDPDLLGRLLDFAPYTDGAGAEVMAGVLFGIARDTPRELLRALGAKPKSVWDCASHLLLYEIEGKPVAEAFVSLTQIAQDGSDPLRGLAERLVSRIGEARKRQAELRQAPPKSPFPLVPRGVSLPKEAIAALKTRWRDWHVMGTSGFDAAVIGAVRSRFGEDAGPQHCWGDFDGNGLRDVALLIRRNIGDGVKLIALRRREGGRWISDELRSFSFGSGFQGGYSGFTIYLAPHSPGAVEFWEEKNGETGRTGRLELRSDGIELNFEGKASVLYYWSGSEYSKVTTGD